MVDKIQAVFVLHFPLRAKIGQEFKRLLTNLVISVSRHFPSASLEMEGLFGTRSTPHRSALAPLPRCSAQHGSRTQPRIRRHAYRREGSGFLAGGGAGKAARAVHMRWGRTEGSPVLLRATG